MKNPNSQINFAAGLKELEDITAWFESEEVDLDQALSKFERGMQLAAQLRTHLETVENRVEKIKQKFDRPAKPPANDLEPPDAETGDPDQGKPDLFSS
ncbi:exodeoxyribonuclease VII small subunit [Candidatus Parcubacteria bacterium]|nr:exodeoxyribonuclease VII small subunit [Candidatus Parcubacteria bacterium]